MTELHHHPNILNSTCESYKCVFQWNYVADKII